MNGFENGTPTYTEFYHISDNRVKGASRWPTYKLEGGDEYIYYFPDAYGWRIGDLLDGTKENGFTYESKYLIKNQYQYVRSGINQFFKR